MTREISYQVRHVVTLPDDFPESDEPTNLTIEETTNAAVFGEVVRAAAVFGEVVRAYTGSGNLHGAGIGVTTRSERLDK